MTLVKPEHHEKQSSPKETTEEGIVMLVKPEHPEKGSPDIYIGGSFLIL